MSITSLVLVESPEFLVPMRELLSSILLFWGSWLFLSDLSMVFAYLRTKCMSFETVAFWMESREWRRKGCKRERESLKEELL